MIDRYEYGMGNLNLVRMSTEGIAAYNAGHQAGASRNSNIEIQARDVE